MWRAKSARGPSGILSDNKRTGVPKDPGLIVYGLAHPLQAGEVHIYREETRIAGHAVHRPLIAPSVRDRSHERLRGRAAPKAGASLAGAPLWVRAQTWFQLGRVPRRALRLLLDAGYVDCFREMRPREDGFTLPSTGPRVRLDYVFAAPALAGALSGCRVVTEPAVAASASDHLPVMAEFGLES